jgi:hypothetical protein
MSKGDVWGFGVETRGKDSNSILSLNYEFLLQLDNQAKDESCVTSTDLA